MEEAAPSRLTALVPVFVVAVAVMWRVGKIESSMAHLVGTGRCPADTYRSVMARSGSPAGGAGGGVVDGGEGDRDWSSYVCVTCLAVLLALAAAYTWMQMKKSYALIVEALNHPTPI